MIAIGAIFKNEYPYITEWLAYHKAVGFNKFYIVDNISDDGSSELLIKLHDKGEIVRIEYKTIDGVKPQVPAYNLIIDKAKNECDYIAFIDADEFFCFSDPQYTVKSLVDRINLFDDIGAIAVNWCLYGSSNCILPGDGLVIERFDHHAEMECHINLHYKSFLKMSAFDSTQGGGVHHFKLKDGYKYIMTDGSTLNNNTGLSEYVSWDLCRLNHYVIKSSGEFFAKKMIRGRAAGNNSSLNKSFFINHDKNQVFGGYSYRFISKIKYLKKTLELSVGVSNSISIGCGEPLYKYGEFVGRSYIDNLVRDGDLLNLHGWASCPNGNHIDAIFIVINNSQVIKPMRFSKKDRPDVVSCGISDYPECGFDTAFDLSLIICSTVEYINVYAINGCGDAIMEINVDNKMDMLLGVFPGIRKFK